MSNIHPTAVIEDGAQIAASAKIGPFCVIGSKAKIGENVQLIAHVTIMNDTTIGDGTIVFPGAVLGGGPQDHGNEFQPEAKLVIGKNNIIRENVTMQCGTPKEHFTTTVGDNGMFMVNCHVAHDCVVGNNVIMTNKAAMSASATAPFWAATAPFTSSAASAAKPWSAACRALPATSFRSVSLPVTAANCAA